jgi:hypothetical protein
MGASTGVEISEDEFPELEAVSAIQRGLHAFNQEMGGPYDREPVTVLARDGAGTVRGSSSSRRGTSAGRWARWRV